jgi:hypothetical protein
MARTCGANVSRPSTQSNNEIQTPRTKKSVKEKGNMEGSSVFVPVQGILYRKL